jgi:hypothetical protein
MSEALGGSNSGRSNCVGFGRIGNLGGFLQKIGILFREEGDEG